MEHSYNIKVFTQIGCIYCVDLKVRLRKLGYEFTELPVEKDEHLNTFKKIMERTGVDSLPVVIVNDKDLLVPTKAFNNNEECVDIIKDIIKC